MNKLSDEQRQQLDPAIETLREQIKASGDPDAFITLSRVAATALKNPEVWPKFAEFVGEDPTSEINYQILSYYMTLGAVADQVKRGDTGPVEQVDVAGPIAPEELAQ